MGPPLFALAELDEPNQISRTNNGATKERTTSRRVLNIALHRQVRIEPAVISVERRAAFLIFCCRPRVSLCANSERVPGPPARDPLHATGDPADPTRVGDLPRVDTRRHIKRLGEGRGRHGFDGNQVAATTRLSNLRPHHALEAHSAGGEVTSDISAQSPPRDHDRRESASRRSHSLVRDDRAAPQRQERSPCRRKDPARGRPASCCGG